MTENCAIPQMINITLIYLLFTDNPYTDMPFVCSRKTSKHNSLKCVQFLSVMQLSLFMGKTVRAEKI